MLMYGNTWFGVLEANYSLAFAQFLTAAMGTGVWDTQVMTLPEQIPLPDMIPRTWSECGSDRWTFSFDGMVHVCRSLLLSSHSVCHLQAWVCMAVIPSKGTAV